MKKNTWRLLIALLLMLGSVNICLAQDPPDDPSQNDPAIPIDCWLSLLLAAGAVHRGGGCIVYTRKRKCISAFICMQDVTPY